MVFFVHSESREAGEESLPQRENYGSRTGLRQHFRTCSRAAEQILRPTRTHVPIPHATKTNFAYYRDDWRVEWGPCVRVLLTAVRDDNFLVWTLFMQPSIALSYFFPPPPFFHSSSLFALISFAIFHSSPVNRSIEKWL